MTSVIIETSIKPFLLIAQNGEPLLFRELAHKRLSSTLLPTLEEMMDEAKLTWHDVNAIGLGTGPGSYIGMRTGATVAKGLAYARDLPLIPFASPIAYLPSLTGNYAYIGDAKMGQCYLFKEGNFLILEPQDLPPHLEGLDWIVTENAKWANGLSPKANPPLIAAYLATQTPKKAKLTYLRT